MQKYKKYFLSLFFSLFCSTCFAINIITVYVWKCHFCGSEYYGNDPTSSKCESKKTLIHVWILKNSQDIYILPNKDFS